MRTLGDRGVSKRTGSNPYHDPSVAKRITTVSKYVNTTSGGNFTFKEISRTPPRENHIIEDPSGNRWKVMTPGGGRVIHGSPARHAPRIPVTHDYHHRCSNQLRLPSQRRKLRPRQTENDTALR
ncbi:hypothetical protein E2C01_067251 [Portunus trituberculatus]|uniref:Uncharacterized protein n=1 Tax=Portunus trituberculatus TaxID=210409 RepID=A0A5B7HUI7_PORTR|nr:hypothetical protein [Portunus trituberculatus]